MAEIRSGNGLPVNGVRNIQAWLCYSRIKSLHHAASDAARLTPGEARDVELVNVVETNFRKCLRAELTVRQIYPALRHDIRPFGHTLTDHAATRLYNHASENLFSNDFRLNRQPSCVVIFYNSIDPSVTARLLQVKIR
jgi:hypothetical protein